MGPSALVAKNLRRRDFDGTTHTRRQNLATSPSQDKQANATTSALPLTRTEQHVDVDVALHRAHRRPSAIARRTRHIFGVADGRRVRTRTKHGTTQHDDTPESHEHDTAPAHTIPHRRAVERTYRALCVETPREWVRRETAPRQAGGRVEAGAKERAAAVEWCGRGYLFRRFPWIWSFLFSGFGTAFLLRRLPLWVFGFLRVPLPLPFPPLFVAAGGSIVLTKLHPKRTPPPTCAGSVTRKLR